MGRGVKRISIFGGSTGVVLATCSLAIADELPASLPVKAPVPYLTKTAKVPEAKGYDWNGWYAGAHVGVIRGASNWSASPQPGTGGPGLGGSFNLPFNFDFM